MPPSIILSLFGVLLVVSGLLSVLAPRAMWYLKEGWKFKNAEPSPAYLALTRLAGLLGLVVGIVILIFLRRS